MFTFEPTKYFLSPNKTLALRIDKEILPQNLPDTFIYEQSEFVLKDRFHISLFPIEELNERYNISFHEEEIKKIFFEFLNHNPIEIGFTSQFRYAEEGDLKSIVVMCEHKNINEFYMLINKTYHLDIKMPVPHVTLYILKDKFGIYLLDQYDLSTKTKEIFLI